MHVQPVMAAIVLVLALLIAPEEAPKPGTAAATDSARARATVGKPATATAAVASRTIVGEIVWVDFPSRLVLVRESVKSTAVKGKPATRETIALAIPPDVPVIRGKQPSSFADLKPKDHVVARYMPTSTGAKAVSLRVADASNTPSRSTAGTPPVPGGAAGETD